MPKELHIAVSVDDDVAEQLTAMDQDDLSGLIGDSLKEGVAKALLPDDEGAAPVTCKRVLIGKADAGPEERFALAPVLEPETTDAQGDIYDDATIRKACHSWMEKYRKPGKKGHLGEMHKNLADGKLAILENYIAPADFTIGDQTVKKGTWLLGLRFTDDTMWEQVKKGEYTGLSIGGFATRTKLAA